MHVRGWVLIFMLAGCGGSGSGRVPVEASLGTTGGTLRPADEAWYSSSPFSMTFEQTAGEGESREMHHLDLWNADSSRLVLDLGTTYSGRGPLPGERFEDQPAGAPWMILVTCSGPEESADCISHGRVDVEVEAVTDGMARISYRGFGDRDGAGEVSGELVAPSHPDGVIFATPTSSSGL